MEVGGNVLTVGAPALAALRTSAPDQPGRVVAVFTRAAYLDCGSGLAAIVPGDVPDGPLHVRVDRLPDLAVGMPVACERDQLVVGDHRWVLPEETWRPPATGDLRAAERLICELVDHEPALGMSATPEPALDGWLVPLLARGDLGEAVARLAGRGAGLTPAGDDVAAGVLLISALTGWHDRAELDRLAADAPTHDISRGFLRAAADGQSIAPVHALLAAAASGDADEAVRAVHQLAGIGHTSGMDLAAGLRAALLGYRLWVTTAARAPREVASTQAHSVP